MTKIIEGYRRKAYERYISEGAFNSALTKAIKENPEPQPSTDHTEYFRWNQIIVSKICEAFPRELR